MVMGRAMRAAPRGAARSSFGRALYSNGGSGASGSQSDSGSEAASAIDALSAIATRLAAVSEAASASDASSDASGGDVPASNPLPAGALSFVVTWDDSGADDGYVVYVSTSTQASPDPALYPYRYLVGAGVNTLTISSVQSGSKYVRVAAHQSGYVGDLSHEVIYTPA